MPSTQLAFKPKKSTAKKKTTVFSELANRYQQAHKKLYDELPIWKRVSLNESISLKKDDWIVKDFLAGVISLAESDAALNTEPVSTNQ